MECDLDKGNSSSAEKNPADVSAREIEITPEMIEAGVNTYGGYFIRLSQGVLEADRNMVCDVFRAMISESQDRL